MNTEQLKSRLNSKIESVTNERKFEAMNENTLIADQGYIALILIFNHIIDKIQSLPVMLLMVSLDREQIVSHSLSTTFCSV